MNAERLECLLRAGCHDYYMAKVLTALISDRPYEEALKHIPTHGAYHVEGWETIASIHETVLTIAPESAYEWMTLAKVPLLEDKHVGYAYYTGTIHGFLKTAIARDTDRSSTPPETPTASQFDTQLPTVIAEIICAPVKMDMRYGSPQLNERVKRVLTESLRRYFFPERPTDVQRERAAEVIRHLHQKGSALESNLGPFDIFLIDRLCHGVLSRRSNTEKIAAIHHLLVTFGNTRPQVSPESLDL